MRLEGHGEVVLVILGIHWDNGKEHGKYYLGVWV